MIFLLGLGSLAGVTIKNVKYHNALKYCNEFLYYNAILRLLLEGYIILALCGFLHLKVVNLLT